MKDDFAEKKFLNSQSNKSRWPYIIGVIGLTALVGICGNHVINSNREDEEFTKNIYRAQQLPYRVQRGDTTNIYCSNESLDTNQIDLCKLYLEKKYSGISKNGLREGEIMYLPDINMDGRVGR